jgi:acetyl/propionyl-CoA carboxylase alpha subunit
VRLDAGVEAGSIVPIHYDPLMAKLIVWGRDRGEAIRRMAAALADFGVSGVRTTIPFHRVVMDHPEFVAGRLSTAFVERLGPALRPAPDPARARAAVVAAALHAQRRPGERPLVLGTPGPSPWALAGRPGRRRPGW